ncbi:MAG: type I methionyl aminopeptidase [Deltaproteobacteria bacterium]|nr:type I methionyl aminopeptidase [Myxococcales bacterium]MCZ6568582.1 type I methionyl aminopeptidase [Deltaproteobacteria bacterium]MCZ6823534.1 type I methionyl aminopeptidase [Deltaproteobacteria bacterium]TDJ02629.1 MAG: type I methionyl aminopeptidase [Deltaproteobacteria bacterium]TDJ07026.1 MAG: type I methionyl aminopeptidase [Deltaproteobacteria bacterium]
MIQLKSESELERMRVAGRHVGDILVWLRGLVEPGITTAEIDRAAQRQIEQRKLESSFLGYGPRGAPPYPAVICTSVNEEIVHGIPGSRELKEGDVLKLDFGVIFEGFHGDSAVSIPVGAIDEKARGLLDATRRALYAGIEQMREGNRLGDVSSAIQCVAEGEGYSVVRDFVGHGIGRSLHEPPQVPNFGPPGRGPRLRVGMVLALEPMVNLGEAGVEILEDGWTATTIDDKLSSHFEHTVAITSHGPEILTRVSGSH